MRHQCLDYRALPYRCAKYLTREGPKASLTYVCGLAEQAEEQPPILHKCAFEYLLRLGPRPRAWGLGVTFAKDPIIVGNIVSQSVLDFSSNFTHVYVFSRASPTLKM